MRSPGRTITISFAPARRCSWWDSLAYNGAGRGWFHSMAPTRPAPTRAEFTRLTGRPRPEAANDNRDLWAKITMISASRTSSEFEASTDFPGDAGEDLWSSPSGSPSQRWRGVHYGESWSQEMINRCRAKIDIAATQTKNPAGAGFLAGRSGVIRTLDPHVPNVVRYQTALHSVTSGASIEQPIWLHKHQIPKSRRKF